MQAEVISSKPISWCGGQIDCKYPDHLPKFLLTTLQSWLIYNNIMAAQLRYSPLTPQRRLATFSLPERTVERLHSNVPAGDRSQFIADLIDQALACKRNGLGLPKTSGLTSRDLDNEKETDRG
jgi:hypothetical protein